MRRITKLGWWALASAFLAGTPAFASTNFYSIGLNFGADEYPDAPGTGSLLATDVAGAPGVEQGNWNNLELLNGAADNMVADNKGIAAATSVAVSWDCANTWSSTGRGEDNNGFPAGSPDYKLMVGYLDSGDPTTTIVTVSGLPSQLTAGYDVYVYMLGGTGGNRGGGYRVTDGVGTTLADYLIGDGPVNPTSHVRDPGINHDDKGTYLVFRGLTAANIALEATTEAPHGLVRAPINAIQLVATGKDISAPSVPGNLVAQQTGAHFVDLKWDASTDNSTLITYEIDRGGTSLGKITGTTYRDTSVEPGKPYAYKVRAIDDSLNASAYTAPLSVTTATETEGTGYLKFEAYTGMESGTAVALLTDWIAAGNKPNFVSYTPSMNSRPVYPDDTHEQYGAVISGWLTPVETGDYTFFVGSDDASELWVSTDATAANLVKVAEETDCCDAFQEPGVANDDASTYPTSEPINLKAGTKYYVQLLIKEGGGGDYGQAAWRKAGDTTPAGALAPIPGAYLSCMVDSSGASITITTQPAAATAVEGRTATFNVAATFTSPYATVPAYQWYRNGYPIGGATEATYTTPELNIATDQGAKFKCSVGVPGAVVFSDEATLTVANDTVGPKITKVKASSVSSLIVTFDEPIDAPSAGTASNYSLSDGVTVSAASASGNSVLLNTASLTVGKSYTLTVSGVKDVFGNSVAAGSQKSFVVNVVTYSDVILADGPVMFYRFEETSGQVTKNYGTAGTAADGLWMAGAGPDDSYPIDVSSGVGPRPGEFLGFAPDNRSGLFTGTEGQLWVDAQQQLLNSLGAFSLEYWVKPKNRVSDPTAFGTRIGIVGQNDAIEYGFIDQNTIQIWTPNGGSLNATYSFPDNTWHHVATIADGKSIKNYFDGKFINQTTATTGNYGSSTYNVHVGGGGAFDATGNHFTGEIDEVAIFQKAIPADRIAAHYKAGKEGGEIPGVDPVISGISRQGNTVVVSYDGVLESASKVTGPWADVAGAPTGAGQSYTTTASASEQYYRAKKE